MDLSVVFEALNPATFTGGVLAGLLMGWFASYELSDDLTKRWSTVPEPQLVPLFLVGLGIPIVAVFYLHQTVIEFIGGLDTWPRVLGRGIVFFAYLTAIAIGQWARYRHEARSRGADK